MKLKQAILLVALALSGLSLPVLSNSIDSDFCDGYRAGFTAGYEQVARQSPTRMSPLCPLKPPGTPANKKAEFEAGFKEGVRNGSR